MSDTFLRAVTQRAADSTLAPLPTRSLSSLGPDAHSVICAGAGCGALVRLSQVSHSWHAHAAAELARRPLPPPHARLSTGAALLQLEVDRVAELAEHWTAVGLDRRDIISWAALQRMMCNVMQAPDAALAALAVLPGNFGGRAAARARYLDELSFATYCRIVAGLEKDYDGSVCEFCGSIWSQVPEWGDYECRSREDPDRCLSTGRFGPYHGEWD